MPSMNLATAPAPEVLAVTFREYRELEAGELWISFDLQSRSATWVDGGVTTWRRRIRRRSRPGEV
jgi:hypothetical protein